MLYRSFEFLSLIASPAIAENRCDRTESDLIAILQLSISDEIAIDLCPVR